MGRDTPKVAGKKAKKPKTEIQRKREERRAKKALPRPKASLVPKPTPSIPKEPKEPKVVRPKPKPQNPSFIKWAALFKRELTLYETHIKHAERFRQHWRAQINNMQEPERGRWERGEVGNYVRLLDMMERSREILAMARERNAWIVKFASSVVWLVC